MIPRTRATFSFDDLGRAVLVSESKDTWRRRFRVGLRDVLGRDDVLLTPSGRAGLYAILVAAARPRVVVPAYTCNAVTEAALLAGLHVDYAEIEEDGFNVDVSRLAPLLGPDAVFVATHQFGIPCAIEESVELAASRGALVVEDAAASLGSRVAGRLTGTFGDAAFYSFDVAKLLSVPLKGGAVTARDPTFLSSIARVHAESTTPMPARVKARMLASSTALLALQEPHAYRAFHQLRFERTGTFTAEAPLGAVERGTYYRYDLAEWQAFVGTRQLARFDELVTRRRALYARYRERLAFATRFRLPPPDTASEWAPIRFPIRVTGDKIAFYRAAARRGVDFAFSFTFLESPPSFTRSHAVADAVLDLPFYADLTRAEEDHVVETLRALDSASAPSHAPGRPSC